MMKNFFYFVLLNFVASLCFSQVPSWVQNPEKEYPSSKFVRAVEEGTSAKNSKNAALATISLYFNAKTEIISVAVKKMEGVFSEDEMLFTSNQSFTQISNVTSSAEFFCVNFSDTYQNKKDGKYYTLAYIDKKKAGEIYKTRIKFLMQYIDTYKKMAADESENFTAVKYLTKAQNLANAAEKYIQSEIVLFPDEAKNYSADLEKISRLPAEIAASKKGLKFFVSVDSDVEKASTLSTTVSSVLEKRGYVYSEKNAQYGIKVYLDFSEESKQAGEFVRPDMKIIVENSDGESVHSYSKSYPKIGGKTIDDAYTRALIKIKQDIEENFLAD